MAGSPAAVPERARGRGGRHRERNREQRTACKQEGVGNSRWYADDEHEQWYEPDQGLRPEVSEGERHRYLGIVARLHAPLDGAAEQKTCEKHRVAYPHDRSDQQDENDRNDEARAESDSPSEQVP